MTTDERKMLTTYRQQGFGYNALVSESADMGQREKGCAKKDNPVEQ